MVRPGSVVADIGTDHAFLPSFLVLQGISPRAVASDVRNGPLQNAKKTVERYSLEDKIDLLLSDGLDAVDEESVQDIIVCGMGGTLIAELLERAQWLKNPDKLVIVQPQSHSQDVRAFFVNNGFRILCEAACRDDGKLYSAMCAQYAGEVREYPPEFIYVGLLPECSEPEARLMIEKMLTHLSRRLCAIEKAGGDPEEILQLDTVVKAIKKTLAEAEKC